MLCEYFQTHHSPGHAPGRALVPLSTYVSVRAHRHRSHDYRGRRHHTLKERGGGGWVRHVSTRTLTRTLKDYTCDHVYAVHFYPSLLASLRLFLSLFSLFLSPDLSPKGSKVSSSPSPSSPTHTHTHTCGSKVLELRCSGRRGGGAEGGEDAAGEPVPGVHCEDDAAFAAAVVSESVDVGF